MRRLLGGNIKTPLKKVVNMTPALVIELEAMGYRSLEDLQQIGWEKLCISYSKTHAARLTPEFFTLLNAIIKNTLLKKVTKDQAKKSEKLYKKIKASSEAGFAKKPKKRI
jgi:hypothetical protein